MSSKERTPWWRFAAAYHTAARTVLVESSFSSFSLKLPTIQSQIQSFL